MKTILHIIYALLAFIGTIIFCNSSLIVSLVLWFLCFINVCKAIDYYRMGRGTAQSGRLFCTENISRGQYSGAPHQLKYVVSIKVMPLIPNQQKRARYLHDMPVSICRITQVDNGNSIVNCRAIFVSSNLTSGSKFNTINN